MLIVLISFAIILSVVAEIAVELGKQLWFYRET